MTVVRFLENGLTFLFERRPGPGFALDLRVPVGAAHDPPGAEGSAALLEEWLFKGAGPLGARALANAFDDLGLRRGGGVTHEETRFSLSGLTEDLERGLTLIADVVRNPHLPVEELSVLADLARQDLESLEDNPAERLGVELRSRAFNAPYDHPVSGTPQALEQLTPEAVRAVHALYGPRRSALAIVADADVDEVTLFVERAFGDWQGGKADLPDVTFHGNWYAHLTEESQQTHMAAVFPGVRPTSPEWTMFHLALGVLSGGSASRLFQEVREARGLAYSVGANVQVMGRDGFAFAYAGSTPERAPDTLDVLLGEFRRLSLGVSAEELNRCRAQLLAGTVFATESGRGRAAMLTRDWLTLGKVRTPGEVRDELLQCDLQTLNGFLHAHPFNEPAVVSLGPGTTQGRAARGEHVPA